jgi:hypothetical protein
MSYVPPHLRSKPLPKQDDFPAFGVTKSKTQFIPKRSFASLANEWSEESEIQKQKDEFRKEVENREIRRRESDIRNLVTFTNNNVKSQEYHPETELVEQQSDEWRTVNHLKLKREFTDEERLKRELAKEEEEKLLKDEQSMWASNSHDDWDYRDRRST